MDRKDKLPSGRLPEPAYRTMAVLDEAEKTSRANVTIPSKQGVIDAKEWIEENKK